MKRFHQRSLLAIALLAMTALVAFVLLWFFWLPSEIASRVTTALAARAVDVEVGSVSPRVGGVVLNDFHFEHRDFGLSGTVERLGVAFSWWDAFEEGTGAVTAVEVRGGEVAFDVDARAADWWRNRTSREVSREQPEEVVAVDTWPRLQVVGLNVLVRDQSGTLARLREVQANPEEEPLGPWIIDVGEMLLFDGSPEELSLNQLHLRADPSERTLSELVAQRGELRLHARATADWRARLGDLRDLAGEVESSAELEVVEAEVDSSVGLLPVLREDAIIRVDSLAIVSERDDTPLARSLSFSVQKIASDALRARGRGHLENGGAVRWNLEGSPSTLRVEGEVGFEQLPFAIVTPFLPRFPWHQPQTATLDGDLHIAATAPGEPLAFGGTVRVADVGVFSERIAPEPIRGITATFRGAGEWDPFSHHILLESAEVQAGDAIALLSGEASWSESRWAMSLDARLPATSCQAAVHAIPEDILGDTAAFSFSGRISARATVDLDSTALDDADLELEVNDGCDFETVPTLADLSRVEGPFEHRVLEPDGTWFEMTTGPGTGTWTSIYGVSPFLVHAVLAHEDASFFRHSGFAPWAIEDALVRNLEEGRFVYGASTITMQLAKNLFLHREKTLARKVQEVLLTWWLERSLEKEQILELYLNVIEYGPGIYGLRQAAWHYFGREPADLSPAESAFLANVLPAPKRFHESYEAGRLTGSMKSRVARFLRHMHRKTLIDEDALTDGLAQIEDFDFRLQGEGRAPPRAARGTATPLPFEGDLSSWDALDGWDSLSDWAWGDDYAEGG